MVHFAVSVCFIHKNKVVAAVIDTPALGEAFWAEEKKSTLLEGFRCRHIKMRMKGRDGGLNRCKC
jgi:myo-inositol-1(or 4)-monophosphatase